MAVAGLPFVVAVGPADVYRVESLADRVDELLPRSAHHVDDDGDVGINTNKKRCSTQKRSRVRGERLAGNLRTWNSEKNS